MLHINKINLRILELKSIKFKRYRAIPPIDATKGVTISGLMYQCWPHSGFGELTLKINNKIKIKAITAPAIANFIKVDRLIGFIVVSF